MDSKDLTIGVLSTTAVILFVGLFLSQVNPAPTYASGMGDRGGDYVLLTGVLWEREELLYVFNTAMNKMIVYRYDLNRKAIVPVHGEDMGKHFGGKAAAPKGRSRGRGRGRRP